MLNRAARMITLSIILLGVALLLAQPIVATPPLEPEDIVEIISQQGFGDIYNNGVWGMSWWKEKLHIGTVRSFYCWSQASLNRQFPVLVPYPPRDEDYDCTPDIFDIPLQAEIWRYTPSAQTWERVYLAPLTVPVQDQPGRFTARDVGYRGMYVFPDADGTEAMYVSGVFPHVLSPNNPPPPRILRTTDGVNFEPVPQVPGTFLGDFSLPSFRGMVTYDSRMFMVGATIQGDGPVLETSNPAGGNDFFQQVSPAGMSVFELIPWNGYLYVGTNTEAAEFGPREGYTVERTDATGTPPYTFDVVVPDGGYLEQRPSRGVISMHIFEGRLYVGTDDPAEMIRINPDDTWDLIVGEPRNTPDGFKVPLSGFDAGFDWTYNVHIWRMQEHQGVLYAGTADESIRVRNFEALDEQYRHGYGFDVYATEDGVYFTAITTTGFGDGFQMGVRNFASTPHGLFIGSVNLWDGMMVYLGIPEFDIYLPLVSGSGPGFANVQGAGPGPGLMPAPVYKNGFLVAPRRLEAESVRGSNVLSWEPLPGATRFHVFRARYTSNRVRGIRELDEDAWVPEPYVQVGTTDQNYFVDRDTRPESYYHYYVVGEDSAGRFSRHSNMARAPSLAPPMTFASLRDIVADWAGRGRFRARADQDHIDGQLAGLSVLIESGDLNQALEQVERLRQKVGQNQPAIVESWYAGDLEIMLNKLARRIRLVQVGLLAPSDLN